MILYLLIEQDIVTLMLGFGKSYETSLNQMFNQNVLHNLYILVFHNFTYAQMKEKGCNMYSQLQQVSNHLDAMNPYKIFIGAG